MSILEKSELKIRGFMSGLEIKNGRVRIWNKNADSDMSFPLSDVRGFEVKKPGRLGRGWLALRTKGHPSAPSGTSEAVSNPKTVVLASGEWKSTKRLADLLERHLAERQAAGDLEMGAPPDPYSGSNIHGRATVNRLDASGLFC